MAARGRPTPQAEPSDPGPGPRFVDTPPERYTNPEANPYVVSHAEYGPPLLTATDAQGFSRDWDRCFGRSAPLHVEIGSGNGFWLAAMGERHPEWNLLGIELRYKRTVLCAKKLDKAGVKTARIARYHAAFLDDLFAEGSISGLYVNHPDPWPRIRQERNRLLSRWFLEDAARLLKVGAWLRVKSDFEPNVRRLPKLLAAGPRGEPLPPLPFEITGVSDDVITGDAPWPDDIETNYQSKFRKKGEPVYAIELVRTAGTVES